MTKDGAAIVRAALEARTLIEARNLQGLIEKAIGGRHERPIGNTWNNQGILTGSGASYDHKILEVVTNMQDAVLERLALQRYGTSEAVPFATPHAAAESLLSGTIKDRAKLTSVDIYAASEARDKKHVTIVMRDLGCGITPADVPVGIFRIGSKHKDGCDWLQGTFGMGGATTYRGAQAVVLISRRDPTLLPAGEPDLITVAVVQWERARTTTNAFYLVTQEWDENDPTSWAAAVPFSVPASYYPEFNPGTHLCLIGYDTDGLGRRSGDEKSFDTIFNTRLYCPVMPISYRNNITRKDRIETLDGLERRLTDNPAEEGMQGQDTLPFTYMGVTYQLPISFRIFNKPGTKGERRNFVANGHALLLTSNGQVHSHWTPLNFKTNTKLNKLWDRILVVVESDALPIEVRTDLFTADRAQLVRTAAAKRLEKEIAAFLNDWPALDDANRALIREAITGDNNDRPTIAIAEKIARAFQAKGFSLGAQGSGKRGGDRQKPPAPTPPEELYDNPTHFEGPEVVTAEIGKVKGVYFKLNAKDGFLGEDQRGHLSVTCDHPDINDDEITVGQLRSGRVRVSVAVPDYVDAGSFVLNAEIPEWPRTSGGLGPHFEWTTKLELVSETNPKSQGGGAGGQKGEQGQGEGGLVALTWRTESDMDEWTALTVGAVELVAAKDLANEKPEYKELAKYDGDIPTLILNRTYAPLKTYIAARAADVTDETKEQSRERYAVGVGVALLILDQDAKEAEKSGKPWDEEALSTGQRAAARAVLSVLPDFDRMARELQD
jgi:hypothetical protein